MAKLKLNVEALAVETFATQAANACRGTVLGAAGVAGGIRTGPVEDTGCTAPCMSGDSLCEMESCGSTCYATTC
jgi:hypothetical protein